jgi:hypothetical protein
LRRGRVYTLHITQTLVGAQTVLEQGPRLYITHYADREEISAKQKPDENFVSPKLADSPTSTSRFVYCIDVALSLGATRA